LNNRLKEQEVSVSDVWFVNEKFLNRFAVQQKIYDYVIHAGLGDDKDNIFIRINNCMSLEEKLPFDKIDKASQ